MLNAFVLTTLDTGTRLGRFIFQELVGSKHNLLKNRWVASAAILILASLLGATEGYKAIWPVFGASNQLVAALALIIVSAYLVGLKRPSKFTLYPACFMLFTTFAALGYQSYRFFSSGKYLLGTVAGILILLALIIVYDARTLIFRSKS
jgi:carbon starvation protein